MKTHRLVLLAAAVMAATTPLLWAQDHQVELQPLGDLKTETATHEEIDPIDVPFEQLTALRLHGDGWLLACDAGAKQIKVINAEGKLVHTVQLEFAPEAINVAADGMTYCGGEGRVAKIDDRGTILKVITLIEEKPADEQADQDQPLAGANSGAPVRRSMFDRPRRVSGIAVTEKDVFVAYGTSWSLRSTSTLYRFDRDLQNKKQLMDGLRGCCQRCDIVTDGDKVYIAENSRYRVLAVDREGEEQGAWGSKGRTGIEGFGSCCNPMNLCFDAKGNLYTAESGLGRIKCYSADGKLLDLIGYVDVERFSRAGHLAASCSNIAIDVTPDGKRVYVMDYKENMIRVLQKK